MSITTAAFFYDLLGSVTNLKGSKLPTLLIAAASAFGGHAFWPEDAKLESPLSEARAEMLAAGIVGNPAELNGKVASVINAHFAAKGYPCDPITASKTIGETMERAKSCNVPTAAPQ